MKAAAAIPAPKEVMPVTLAAKPPRAALEIKGDRKTVPWSAIHRSKLNPRTHFEVEPLKTLADSIAVEGVQENLTVRPHPKIKDAFEIVAGDRRYQAVGILIDQGRAKPDFAVPVLIRELDDTHVITLAMTENMAREELTPMEEARGFHALTERGVPTATIALHVGVTQRFVQQRLALVEKATDEVQQALDDGKITVTHARTLMLAKPAEQKKLVKRLVDPENQFLRREENLRSEVIGRAPRTGNALFERKLYTGEILTDEEGAAEYFVDVKQFEKLQNEEIKRRLKVLGDKWSWVETTTYFYKPDYRHAPDDKKAGCLVVVSPFDGKFEAHEGLVKITRETPAQARSSAKAERTKKPAAKPEDAFTHGHRVHAHVRKTFALQRALAADPLTGQRMLCHALLMEKGCDPLNVTRKASFHDRRGFKDHQGPTTAPEVNALLAKLLDGCPGVKVSEKAGFDEAAEKHALGVWQWLVKKDADRIVRLLAALTADLAGTWCDGHSMPVDDDEVAAGVAEQLGLAGNEHKAGLTLEAADLEGLRKPALLGICRDLGMLSEIYGADSWGDHATPKMTGAAIAALIAKRLKAPAKIGGKDVWAPRVKDYVLPTLHFTADSSAELKKLVKEAK